VSNNIGQFLDINVWDYGEYRQFIYLSNDIEKSLTNRQILNNARALATGLKIRGIKKGDVVASVLSNIPEIPEIINGVNRTGATYLPIVFMFTPPEIRYIIEDSACKVIITEDTLLPKVLEASAGLKPGVTIILIGQGQGKGITNYDDLLTVSDERGNMVEVDRDDMALLMYTPGVTGYPKGVMLSHYNMYTQMKACISVWGTDKGESLITTVPMNTIYGTISCLEGYLTGFTNILMPPFDPRKVLDTVRKHRVSVLPIVPTMLNFMLMVWDEARDDLSSLDLLICSGAPLPQDTLIKAQKTFGVEITQGYGCTEVGGIISLQRRDWPHKPGSTGFPMPGITVKIVDDDGTEAPRGVEGEIICKGPMVTRGYLNKPKETADAFKNGWFYTGDVGKFDEDGELYVTGRKKEIIIKGGENIDPGISENWLYKHPEILECAVFAMDDNKYGEEVGAAVVLKPGCDISEEKLLEYLSEHVHHYMAPRRIFFLKALPKTGTGKIIKKELKRIVKE
jgi:long-chain acyl-CoA synthetase